MDKLTRDLELSTRLSHDYLFQFPISSHRRRTAALREMMRTCLAPVLLLSSAAAFQLTRVPIHEPARRVITRTCGDVRAALGVKHLISDLEFLGPCRFIVSGKGAILEAVGAFEGLRESKKGLATVIYWEAYRTLKKHALLPDHRKLGASVLRLPGLE